MACSASVAAGQQGESTARAWSGSAELSAVATSGNSEGRTFGFQGEVRRNWEDCYWTLRAGGLGAEANTIERRAERQADGTVRLSRRSITERTAETFFVRTKFHRELALSWEWFAGASWERNEFAGLSQRWAGVLGATREWFDTEVATFTTGAGLTLTRELPVVAKPGKERSQVGIELSWDYRRKLTATTSFTSSLKLDENLEETGDLRVDTSNSMAVSITDRLALKVGYQILFDAEPATIAVPVTFEGERTDETIRTEVERLDSTFTAALLLTF